MGNGEHGSHGTPIREVPNDPPHVALGEVSPRRRGDERAHKPSSTTTKADAPVAIPARIGETPDLASAAAAVP